jgi:hypothetical protein
MKDVAVEDYADEANDDDSAAAGKECAIAGNATIGVEEKSSITRKSPT